MWKSLKATILDKACLKTTFVFVDYTEFNLLIIEDDW